MSWSYLRSSALPPLGTRYLPDTPQGFVRYLSGGQYGAAKLPGLDFYVDRLVQHAPLFFGSFTWIGISLGLLGVVHHWRSDRPVCVGILLVFAANFLYFTGYAATDYQTMVTASYVAFSLWVAYGVAFLARLTARPAARAGDDAAEVKWFPLDALPELAFDHADILARVN